jgi:hypothetical protein
MSFLDMLSCTRQQYRRNGSHDGTTKREMYTPSEATKSYASPNSPHLFKAITTVAGELPTSVHSQKQQQQHKEVDLDAMVNKRGRDF